MVQKKKKDTNIFISDSRFSPITSTIVDESMSSTSTNPINNEIKLKNHFLSLFKNYK